MCGYGKSYDDIQNTHRLSFAWRPSGSMDITSKQSFNIPPKTEFNNVSKNCILTLRNVSIANLDEGLFGDISMAKKTKIMGIRISGMGIRSNTTSFSGNNAVGEHGTFTSPNSIFFPNDLGSQSCLSDANYVPGQFSQTIGNNNIDFTCACSNPFGKQIQLEIVYKSLSSGIEFTLNIPNKTNAVPAHGIVPEIPSAEVAAARKKQILPLSHPH